MDATTFTFPTSAFPPLALGFFGLGTGYLIYGPQEFFGFPKRETRVDLSTGVWGIAMPGLCQFVAGTYLFVGLALHLFSAPPLYAAALAFTVYGIHWFAIGFNRARGGDARPNAFMAVPFMFISILGMIVFFHAGDIPVGLLFAGLTAIYLSDMFASFKVPLGERSLGFFHLLTGFWLIYLTFASTLDFSSGFKLWQ
ncbi:MAG TPA: hypothetical protein VNH82_11800 [Candidatus Dormibacteraeota bacterium]|nr:hypothetical protein [Candidatus Dormibacteraeota bacterium]